MGIKNFWSLNVDEALVADKLQRELKKKNYDVFFPLNSQLKDIDLIVSNLKTRKSYFIQVKGSRTYEPQKREVLLYGDGRSSWFSIKYDSIFNTKNPVDYFIFIIHLEEKKSTKRDITLNYLVIPTKDLKKILTRSKKSTRVGKKFDFAFWINPEQKKVFDIRSSGKPTDYTKYLNNFSNF